MPISTDLALPSIVRRSSQPGAAMVDGQAILMSFTTNNYCAMDSVGTRIWELLQSPMSVAAVCDVLEREYEVGRGECENDVLVFLRQMLEQDVIEVVG